YLGVAAIGGGRDKTLVGQADGPAFLVVTGSHDFAAVGAQELHRSLLEQDLKSRFEILAAVEHMGVVQFSLPLVFEFFDELLER
ncbi:MAG: hypothetical protein GY888_20105, partial [Planctomycetaceae bacterium]|nr:hypothetical protein [Planctomycetaceae bacterium]